jgi:uncharacterized protein
MPVVDFHMHFFSRVFFETLASLSPLPGTPEEHLQSAAKKAGLQLPDADVKAHTARWLAEADRNDVEQLCAFASVPEEIPALAEAGKHAGGRIVPFALVNPTAPAAADRVRGLVREQGFGGVLMFPAMHHYHLKDPACEGVLQALNETRAVCYVHCGLLIVKLRDLLGIPRVQDLAFASPLGIVPVANRFPDVRFVIPHFGAGFFREALLAGAQCANVHVDTSSSNSWTSTQEVPLSLADVFRRALGVFGPKRILFGTDSNVFPAGWRADRLAEQRAALESAGASATDIEAITGGNARRILSEVRR